MECLVEPETGWHADVDFVFAAWNHRPSAPAAPRGKYGYTYDGSSAWSIGPADDPQVDPICNINDRNDERARHNAQMIVDALNSATAESGEKFKEAQDALHWCTESLEEISGADDLGKEVTVPAKDKLEKLRSLIAALKGART